MCRLRRTAGKLGDEAKKCLWTVGKLLVERDGPRVNRPGKAPDRGRGIPAKARGKARGAENRFRKEQCGLLRGPELGASYPGKAPDRGRGIPAKARGKAQGAENRFRKEQVRASP